jgi:hypothetical protein
MRLGFAGVEADEAFTLDTSFDQHIVIPSLGVYAFFPAFFAFGTLASQ